MKEVPNDPPSAQELKACLFRKDSGAARLSLIFSSRIPWVKADLSHEKTTAAYSHFPCRP